MSSVPSSDAGMVIKLGINGFGRIGRVIFRAGLKKADLEIAAINDPAIDVEYICYLIKFDSTHGKLLASVTHTKNEIIVDGCCIKVFHEKLPSNVPWQTAGVQYVIEASGMFTSLEKASGHLASDGVKRVIVTAPSVDVPMVILGVNHDKLNAGQKVISCASSTLYCLAPIVKVLEDSFGVAEGFITSIHAMTPSLKPLDGLCLRGKHWRDHRSIHQNIIPATTGACKALGRIIPRVKDKLSGLAFRVPIVNVSVLDLTIRLNSNTTIHDIINRVEKASSAVMQNIIKISKEEAVSSDFIGESHSCILDADSSLQLKPNFFKLVCWYENEYSYACRVIDSIFYSEKQTQLNAPPKMLNSRFSSPSKKQDMVQQTDSCKKDVLCSASQDTALKLKQQPNRSLILRKPISSHNSGATQALNGNKDNKRRNEIFKIWDDIKEVPKPIRQNRNAFFHSCVTITPQNREEIECIKAHERLEMLKKEFSKMVNITESLLKKSYIGGVHVKPDDKVVNKKEMSKSFNILPEINVEEIKRSCDTFTEMNDSKKSSLFLDIGGDYRTSISSKNTNILNNTPGSQSIEKITSKFQLCPSKKINYESRNKLIIFENIPKIKPSYNAVNIHDDKEKLNEKKLDAIKFETKDNPQNIQVQYCVVDNNRKCTDKKNTKPSSRTGERPHVKDTLKWKSRIGTSDSGFFSLFKKNSAAELVQNKQDDKNDRNNNGTEQKTLTDCIKIVDENKGQVQNCSDTFNDVDNNPNVENSPPIVKMDGQNDEIQSLAINCDNNDGQDLIKQSSEDIIKCSSPDPISTESDHTSKCGSPVNTSLTVSNVEVYKHKQDIYDKLDSISGTDSNNSFQIHEKKSQIINISDLTSSLEDLARLDKICKIIEISDELSNELFSALDSNEGVDLKKKKWSFKDLCERIKLDDFCEKIFGKSSE